MRSPSSRHSENSPAVNEKQTASEKSSSNSSRQNSDRRPANETVNKQQPPGRFRRSSADKNSVQENKECINSHEIKTSVQVEKYVPYASKTESDDRYSPQTEKRDQLGSASPNNGSLKQERLTNNGSYSNRYFDSEPLKASSSSGIQRVSDRVGGKRPLSDNDFNEFSVSERTIPIKITPEAKQILERNAQLFSRNSLSGHDESQVSKTLRKLFSSILLGIENCKTL